MEAHVASEDKDKFLFDLAHANKYPPKAAGEEHGLQQADGWEDTAKIAMSMFESHPVWTFDASTDIDIDYLDSIEPSHLKLVPITDKGGYEFWCYFRRGCSADPGLGRWSPTFVGRSDGLLPGVE